MATELTFLQIIKNSQNFYDFSRQLNRLNNNLKGLFFEKFAMYYFLSPENSGIELVDYMQIAQVPRNVLYSLNLPKEDIGIDAILKTPSEEWIAIQIKYKTNIGQPTPWKELATFVGTAFGISNSFKQAIIFTNADCLTDKLKYSTRIRGITSKALDQLPEAFFRKIEATEREIMREVDIPRKLLAQQPLDACALQTRPESSNKIQNLLESLEKYRFSGMNQLQNK